MNSLIKRHTFRDQPYHVARTTWRGGVVLGGVGCGVGLGGIMWGGVGLGDVASHI